MLDKTGLVAVQLHGEEPPEYAEKLEERGCFVIKVVFPGQVVRNYRVDPFLLDESQEGETGRRDGGGIRRRAHQDHPARRQPPRGREFRRVTSPCA